MAIEKAKEFFRERGMEDRVLEFDASSATVELAAAAVGCEPARIAKTLSFHVDGQVALVVAAGDADVYKRQPWKRRSSRPCPRSTSQAPATATTTRRGASSTSISIRAASGSMSVP